MVVRPDARTDILVVRLFQHIIFKHLSYVGIEDSAIKIIRDVTSIVDTCNLCACMYACIH